MSDESPRAKGGTNIWEYAGLIVALVVTDVIAMMVGHATDVPWLWFPLQLGMLTVLGVAYVRTVRRRRRT